MPDKKYKAPEAHDCSNEEENWVGQEINQQRAYYDEMFRSMHYIRRMRFMRLKSNAPRPFQKIMGRGLQSPFSYRLVQTATSMIGKERPKFDRNPKSQSGTDREAASRLVRSADPMLQMLERIARKPLFWQLLDMVIGDGRGTIKGVKDTWAGYPIKNEEGYETEDERAYNNRVASFVVEHGEQHPLRARLVDPLNVLVPPTEFEPPYQIEQGYRPLVSTMNKLGLKFGVNNSIVPYPDSVAHPIYELPRGMAPNVPVEELWTDDYCFVRIHNRKVVKYENELGFIPYVNVFGEVTSLNDPALQSPSILYPYQGIEPWFATLMSTMAAWSILGGTPILWTSRRPYQGAPPPNETTISEIPLGKRIDLGTGGEAGFLQPPPIGREVLEFLNTLVGFMDRAGITPLASGVLGNRTPGTAFSAAIEAATGKLKVVQSNVEVGIAEWVKMMWKIVEHLDQPIVVTGMGLQKGLLGEKMASGKFKVDPADIKGYYDLSCTLTVSSLQDTVSKGMHAAFMKQHGLWSRDRAMKFSGVEDPWEEYQEGLRDQLEESPFIKMQILQKALAEDPELKAQADALQAQGVDMGALLTGAVSGAMPGMQNGGGVGGGGNGNIPGPAPRRGGRPKGMPKRPGGTATVHLKGVEDTVEWSGTTWQ